MKTGLKLNPKKLYGADGYAVKDGLLGNWCAIEIYGFTLFRLFPLNANAINMKLI